MPGIRLTAVNAGPLHPGKNKLVAFADPGPIAAPTTVGIIERPKHGLILWDTGINDAVADPDRGEHTGDQESVTHLVLTRLNASTPSMLN